MIRHTRERGNPPNPKRFEMIRKTHQTYMTDGINSIKYEVWVTNSLGKLACFICQICMIEHLKAKTEPQRMDWNSRTRAKLLARVRIR